MPAYTAPFAAAGAAAGGGFLGGLGRNAGMFKNKLTPRAESAVVFRYESGDTVYQIASDYEINAQTVCNILERASCPRRSSSERHRKYRLDESVFDNITRRSAYWIGFLMADGNVYESKDANKKVVSIHLAAGDIGHLQKFRDFVRTDKPVRRCPDGSVVIELNSVRMADSLARWGVTPRKSKSAKVIHLEYDKDFWRGVVDGDGYVAWSMTRHYPMLGCSGSESLMNQFAEYIRTVRRSCKSQARERNGCWNVATETMSAMMMLQELYTNCLDETVLGRKKEAAIYCIRNYAEIKWRRSDAKLR